ncbi:hypothetical protein PR003_g13051 [Phytophthora rubi]|uniref:Uncharacterized protein n=2 Tax=Phytophthora TaxID=4783 RepID=A0A6A4F6I6_9STRA|nr:hypothetical protein PF008_g28530 [Phytophthora fragariae]KAE9335354.1 hypothetical protein PR003_g13051 [Phytophthora rubi]
MCCCWHLLYPLQPTSSAWWMAATGISHPDCKVISTNMYRLPEVSQTVYLA